MSRDVLEALARWRSRAYALGSVDCALFAADVVATRTGRVDVAGIASRLAGRYTDLDTGLDLLQDELAAMGVPCQPGDHPLEVLCRHLFGAPVAPLQARRWDLVLGDWGEGPSLGICDGHRVVAVAEHGLARFPLRHATHAWHLVSAGNG